MKKEFEHYQHDKTPETAEALHRHREEAADLEFANREKIRVMNMISTEGLTKEQFVILAMYAIGTEQKKINNMARTLWGAQCEKELKKLNKIK
jgi:hypothetical protein